MRTRGDLRTSNESWTCIVNNAKHIRPLDFVTSETWRKFGSLHNDPFIYVRTLDSKPQLASTGTMERNTVFNRENVDKFGLQCVEISKFSNPVDEFHQVILAQDVTCYSKTVLQPPWFFLKSIHRHLLQKGIVMAHPRH